MTCMLQPSHDGSSAGGLGAVGSLASLWLARLSPQSHQWLLSRTGRGTFPLASLGDAMVSMARCNVSSAEEAAFLMAEAGASACVQVSPYRSSGHDLHRCPGLALLLLAKSQLQSRALPSGSFAKTCRGFTRH